MTLNTASRATKHRHPNVSEKPVVPAQSSLRKGGRTECPTGLTFAKVRAVVDEATGNELHSKLAGSLASSVLGVMQAGAMGVSLIGAALATSQGLDPKHATKQVDRLLSNPNLQLEQLDAPWVRFVLGERKDVVIALDWTDYARDGHSVIAANVVTAHGRATPLCWKTVRAAELSDGGRIDAEDTLLLRLRSAIPDDVRVTIIADRGFGGTALYKFLSDRSAQVKHVIGGLTLKALAPTP